MSQGNDEAAHHSTHNPTHQWVIELIGMIKTTIWSNDSSSTSSQLGQKRLPTRTLGM